MAILLGIDTGGTYTDAVLFDDEAQTVLSKAKSLTTRHDLSVGISGAVDNALNSTKIELQQIGLVSLSTTLATNALVEGQGGRIALISIGFTKSDIDKPDLKAALGDNPVIYLQGGHSTHGGEAAALNLEPLKEQIENLREDVSGFAVAGYFAVRNPNHEIRVREFLLDNCDLPVTCSHELSAKLNGPRRALTTVLNARLITMIARLIGSAETWLTARGISAPLMVVRGDGALVSAEFTRHRPIETILSGPAASIVGARWLTGQDNAVVSDIGGTTTDVAILQDGLPKLSPEGAQVGGWQTMVEAVAMHTFGLGGDSEISLNENRLRPKIALGPRRLHPLSMVAAKFDGHIIPILKRQLQNGFVGRNDGRFALRTGSAEAQSGLSASEQSLFSLITGEPKSLDALASDGTSVIATLDQLVAKGLVAICGLTPTDCMHVLGRHTIWNREAADLGAQLFARRKDGYGKSLSSGANEICERIIAAVERRSAEVVLVTAFSEVPKSELDPVAAETMANSRALIEHPLVQRSLDLASVSPQSPLVKVGITLDRPIIGLGASAEKYLPPAANLLGVDCIVPEHADVANAIGAVIGQISVKTEVAIAQPAEGILEVLGEESKRFANSEEAFTFAEEMAEKKVADLARQAGAGEVEIRLERDIKTATIEEREMFVEGRVIARATGRPPVVSG